ncbi:NADPH-dependent oxidoreductase [Philodulcilactobacillus myokoensis]|uniref:NADPH-dependent oxidoreductase n=1 Tax=Philodulcilactobacillus myokoensis TaxID=2929573 RepID=A0A9W6B0N6_9LACO|nr:nitroreductase family protein [Philodulcilactobacillus myokoensis]GLB46288.1 NADPH-dependent oxidoreductase [Philodulcilactobacillus myokoensis]
MNNQTLKTLFNHRSIRKFKHQNLTQEQIKTLLKAAQQASTSQFEQQYSIISVTDPKQLQVIADVTGFDFVKSAGQYFLFVADQHRNEQILKSIDPNADTSNLHSTDKLLAGIHDVDFAMQAMLTAAESMGLGGVVMGSIYNDTSKIIKAFKLPQLTFPVLGLALGVPDEKSIVKPRITPSIIHYQNVYNDDINQDQLNHYDQIVHDYYQKRPSGNRSETFTHHLMSDLQNNPIRKNILPNFKKQGFLKL